MNTTMLFFDVDGTLMDNQTHTVPDSTIKALQLLKQQNIALGIATGRSPSSLANTGVMEIIPWDVFICNNGQTILDSHKNCVRESFFPIETVEQCITIAKANNIPLALKQEHRLLTQPANQYVEKASRFFNNPIPPVRKYQQEPVQAMIAYGPAGYDYHVFSAVPGITLLPGVSTYCDITIAGVSKANAIKEVLPHFHADSYIAFGDSANDISMFHDAKFAIAMQQGDPKALEAADFVTKAVSEDGIYFALQTLQYIKE